MATRSRIAAGARRAASLAPNREVHARVTSHHRGGWFDSAKSVSFQVGAVAAAQVAPSSSETKKTAEPQGGAAFQALLEKLQQQAQNLQRDSETVARPEELSGAVDRAHSSLQDALSLSDRLLEAYREAMHNGGTGSAPSGDGDIDGDVEAEK